MKKYIIIYVLTYLILLLFIVTKGINVGFEWNVYDDYLDHATCDGFSGSSTFLIFNFIIIIYTFILSLIITISKSNKIKFKKLIFTGIIILSLFVPISIEHRSGGIAGISEERYSNILMIRIGTKILS